MADVPGTGVLPFAPTLRDEAEAWMDQNPQIMRLFRRFAREAMARGRRFGVKLLAERVRWECMVAWAPESTWKINNNHVAYVARRLLSEMPDLAPYLETRRVRS